MLPYVVCCSHGLFGTGLPRALLLLTAVFVVDTISPGFAVPEASTTSLVLPCDGGLNGAGPDEDPALSQGFGGGLLPRRQDYSNN